MLNLQEASETLILDCLPIIIRFRYTRVALHFELYVNKGDLWRGAVLNDNKKATLRSCCQQHSRTIASAKECGQRSPRFSPNEYEYERCGAPYLAAASLRRGECATALVKFATQLRALYTSRYVPTARHYRRPNKRITSLQHGGHVCVPA